MEKDTNLWSNIKKIWANVDIQYVAFIFVVMVVVIPTLIVNVGRVPGHGWGAFIGTVLILGKEFVVGWKKGSFFYAFGGFIALFFAFVIGGGIIAREIYGV